MFPDQNTLEYFLFTRSILHQLLRMYRGAFQFKNHEKYHGLEYISLINCVFALEFLNDVT